MGYYSHKSAKGGFGSALGKIGGAIVGFATGGVPGAIKGHIVGGKIGSALSPSRPQSQPTVPTKKELIGGPLSYTPLGGIVNAVARRFGPGAGGTVEMVNGQCPVGYHPNKQKSAKGDARTYCVRNRSMNPANGKAIGRAATRIKKGAKQYARVLRILGKKTGKMVPRGRKRT